jgi:hypothetical protein
MKKFLVKLFIFLAILLLIASSLVCIVYNYSSQFNFPFYSNSISYNAKVKFILDQKGEVEKCKVFVIGSSMSLNNLDCSLLSDNLDQKVFNLSSWGLKFNDFSEFDIWKKKNIIITNINFSDFGNSVFNKKTGYPYNSSRLLNVYNILGDYLTYRSQINEFYRYPNLKINNTYNSLNFNNNGSVIFSDKKVFKIDKKRWEEIPNKISINDINNFVNDVKLKASLVNKIIITFSPNRIHAYSKEKYYAVKLLESRLNIIPNVIFFNNYSINDYVDEDFVDGSHFSKSGALKYTKLISSQIKSIK